VKADLPKDTTWNPLMRWADDPTGAIALIRRLVLENARLYAGRYALAFTCMALVAATTAASAWIMRDVIDRIFVARDERMVWILAAFVMVIFLVKGAASYGQDVILNRIGNDVVARSQKRLFARLIEQGVDYFNAHSSGELTARITHNANAARSVLNAVMVSFGRDLLTLIGLIIVMIAQDPLMFAIVVVIMPVSIYGVSQLIRRVRVQAESEFVAFTRIVSATQEMARGIRTIKAFNLEGRMTAIAEKAIASARQRANKIATINARSSPLMETLGGLAVAGVILYGGFSVLNLGRQPGAFFAFITALLMSYEPAKRLARLHINLEKDLVGVRLLYEAIDSDITQPDRPGAQALTVSAGDVELQNVSFAYDDGKVLRDVDLKFRAGTVNALVGPSGAGKTTVFSLIERFYSPQKGRVLIDGFDLAEMTGKSVREHIALVSQDTFLFEGTVAENIAVSRPDAGRQDIIAAATAANAAGFIEALPQGYETVLPAGGDTLSGGQKQRLAIARAMLHDAKILLLDEATSALDSESEALILEALDRLMAGRTTIVIAHRLSTVRRADCIHVMDAGRIVQSGPHDTLIAEDGLYARLHALQFDA
jgi:ATP-binding cassette subfamily B protein